MAPIGDGKAGVTGELMIDKGQRIKFPIIILSLAWQAHRLLTSLRIPGN